MADRYKLFDAIYMPRSEIDKRRYAQQHKFSQRSLSSSLNKQRINSPIQSQKRLYYLPRSNSTNTSMIVSQSLILQQKLPTVKRKEVKQLDYSERQRINEMNNRMWNEQFKIKLTNISYEQQANRNMIELEDKLFHKSRKVLSLVPQQGNQELQKYYEKLSKTPPQMQLPSNIKKFGDHIIELFD